MSDKKLQVSIVIEHPENRPYAVQFHLVNHEFFNHSLPDGSLKFRRGSLNPNISALNLRFLADHIFGSSSLAPVKDIFFGQHHLETVLDDDVVNEPDFKRDHKSFKWLYVGVVQSIVEFFVHYVGHQDADVRVLVRSNGVHDDPVLHLTAPRYRELHLPYNLGKYRDDWGVG